MLGFTLSINVFYNPCLLYIYIQEIYTSRCGTPETTRVCDNN